VTLAFVDAPTATMTFESASYSVTELMQLRTVEGKAQQVQHDLLNSGATFLRRAWLRQYFHDALERWQNATATSSLLEDKRSHPLYRRIVDMGEDVIPLILEEVGIRPSLIFTALHDITGADPILPEHRGRVGDMIRDWIDWGVQHGYMR